MYKQIFPLVWKEVTDFQIDKAVKNGMIPRHYMIDDATDRLKGYVEVYLREEIRDEAAVQDVEAFEQFMEVAAISDGEMINYANIAIFIWHKDLYRLLCRLCRERCRRHLRY